MTNEQRYYEALKRITLYDQPERLRKRAERDYGVTPDEAVEMAYENVLNEARMAIKKQAEAETVMGWAVGYDSNWRRDVGYGVVAYCDEPGCNAVIDRGLAYVCADGQPYGGHCRALGRDGRWRTCTHIQTHGDVCGCP